MVDDENNDNTGQPVDEPNQQNQDQPQVEQAPGAPADDAASEDVGLGDESSEPNAVSDASVEAPSDDVANSVASPPTENAPELTSSNEDLAQPSSQPNESFGASLPPAESSEVSQPEPSEVQPSVSPVSSDDPNQSSEAPAAEPASDPSASPDASPDASGPAIASENSPTTPQPASDASQPPAKKRGWKKWFGLS